MSAVLLDPSSRLFATDQCGVEGAGLRCVALARLGLEPLVLLPVAAGLVEEPANLLLLDGPERAARARATGARPRRGLPLDDAQLAGLRLAVPGEEEVEVSAVTLEERGQQPQRERRLRIVTDDQALRLQPLGNGPEGESR